MLKTNSAACIKHAANLASHQLAAIPAENTSDAKIIARAELANLWSPTDCWSEGVLIEFAEYLENFVYEQTGADQYAVYELPSLAKVMDSKSAALLVCRLAGGYRTNMKGKEVMTNRADEKFGIVVTFPDTFARDFWAYLSDEMAWVLQLDATA